MTSPSAPPATGAPMSGASATGTPTSAPSNSPGVNATNGTGPNDAGAAMLVRQPMVSASPTPAVPPMYWRVLRLYAVRPNGWQRAVLVEGVIGIAVVLALADVASAWTVVVLPLVAMAVVKAHDYLAGLLDPDRRSEPPPARVADYAVFAGIPIGILLLRLVTHPSGSEGTTSGVILGVLAVIGGAIFGYRYLRQRAN
jgi:hypothetical protein